MPSSRNFLKRIAAGGAAASSGRNNKSGGIKNSNTKDIHFHRTTEPLDVSHSIRSAINEGAPLYNANNKQGCYEIYLATAYQILSQETLSEVMIEDMKHVHTQQQSQRICDLLFQATTESRTLLSSTEKNYDEGAWILRRAFDEILKLEASSKRNTARDDDEKKEEITKATNSLASSLSLNEELASDEELRAEGIESSNLANTLDSIIEIKDRAYRLKTYKQCFVGKDAVTKLVDNHIFMSRGSALKKLQQLTQIGIMEHVTKEHSFKDSDLFYRFTTPNEINKLLKPYRNRSQLLEGPELFHYTALLGRYKHFHKHPSLGVIRLDYDYPPTPGDIDSPNSYNYPVYFRAVPGLTFEMCQSGQMTPDVAQRFDEAVLWLAEHQDVSVITGDCGFMMWFTERARSLCTKKPILLSALMQLPTMIAACAPEDKIIVMTANGKSLMPMLDLIQRHNGMDTMADQIVIVGCEDVPYFGEPVAKGLKVDAPKAEPGIVAKTLEAIEQNPGARMILMECTELPPYSDAVREATRLPVYDSITCSDYAMSGYLDNDAFGLNGWYEPWDGVQEEYVVGQNLDESARLQCIWCTNNEHNHNF